MEGNISAKGGVTNMILNEAVRGVREIRDAAVRIKEDCIFLSHGGHVLGECSMSLGQDRFVPGVEETRYVL